MEDRVVNSPNEKHDSATVWSYGVQHPPPYGPTTPTGHTADVTVRGPVAMGNAAVQQQLKLSCIRMRPWSLRSSCGLHCGTLSMVSPHRNPKDLIQMIRSTNEAQVGYCCAQQKFTFFLLVYLQYCWEIKHRFLSVFLRKWENVSLNK